MTSRKYLIPGLTFERLASDDEALKAFQQLLKSIKDGDWDVYEAKEQKDNGISGLELVMKPDKE